MVRRLPGNKPPRAKFCLKSVEKPRELVLRVIFAICVLCFAAAAYSGYRIVSDTHLPKSYGPSQIPGASNSSHRDSAAMLPAGTHLSSTR
jgi:hypothetical protein